MLEKVEQDIDGETAEEVDAVGKQEGRIQWVVCHLVAGPGESAVEGAQLDSHTHGQMAGHSRHSQTGKSGT